MTKSSLLNYFINGFSLANRSLEIYLIGIGLSLFGVLAGLLEGNILGKILQLVSFITVFFTFGYQMSVPLLLTHKQESKQLVFKSIWEIVLRNSKRMILPVILFGILFMVLFFALIILWVVMSHPSNSKDMVAAMKNFIEQLRNWNPFFIIFGAIFSLFAFTPIYFSIENKGFFASVKRSVSFSFKHLNFMMLLILIGAINYTVITLIRVPIENRLALFVLTAFTQYTGLIISASTLLYYQDHHNSQSTIGN